MKTFLFSVSISSTTMGVLEYYFKQRVADYYTRIKGNMRGFSGHFARKLRISFSFIT